MIKRELALFAATFTTLLAIINPLEVLPVYLKLLAGADVTSRRALALQSSVYATGLCFFFLIFGTLLLRIFDVPLSMVRIVGGIILMKIGFELFSSSPSGKNDMLGANAAPGNIAFVPLAMPLMFGPGAIATVLGMTSKIRQSSVLVIRRHSGCNCNNDVRNFSLSGLRRQADQEVGANGNRCGHPWSRLGVSGICRRYSRAVGEYVRCTLKASAKVRLVDENSRSIELPRYEALHCCKLVITLCQRQQLFPFRSRR
jgi:small neutral amino acid transporter SnatA (MarC family)